MFIPVPFSFARCLTIFWALHLGGVAACIVQATAVSGAVQTAKLIIIGPKEAARITTGEIIAFGSGGGFEW